METRRAGSAVIMLLLIVVAITLMGAVALKSATLAFDLTLDRVNHQKNTHALQALALYGIALGWQRYSGVDEKKREPYVTQLQHWPLPNGKYEGSLSLTPQKKRLVIIAQLGKKGSSNCTIQCEIDTGKQEWRVVKWAQ